MEDGRLVQKLSERFLNPKTTALDVVNVAVRLIRENANNGIGEDCSSIVVPNNFSEEPAVYYHPNHASSDLRFPTFVQASHGAKGAGFAMNGLTRYEGKQGSPPIAAGPPPTFRREKCWCGSGSEYRGCHGKPGAPVNMMPSAATGIHHGLDTRQLAPAAGGAQFWMPPYLFHPGTTIDQYTVTNMRTGIVERNPAANPGS